MGMLDTIAREPFHVAVISSVPADSTKQTGDPSLLVISVGGGVAPYTLTATNTVNTPLNDPYGLFNVNLSDSSAPTKITLKDATGATLKKTFNVPASSFSLINAYTLCTRTFSYEIILSDSEFVKGARILLTGKGFRRISKNLKDTFSDVMPGDYTLTITPLCTSIKKAACGLPVILPITIPEFSFDVSAKNTVFSQGSNLGEVVLTAVGGMPAFSDFTLTGPLPTTSIIQPSEIEGAVSTFTQLEGGFYTASVTDNDGCTVTKQVTVNFFENAGRNRRALTAINK